MVSSVLRITSQVEHKKKYKSIDSESKSVKRNADHQNRLKGQCIGMEAVQFR